MLRDMAPAIKATARQHRSTGRIGVYGSIARGEATPDSDIDFLIEFEEDASLFDLVALQTALAELIGKPVDVLSAAAEGRAADHARTQSVPL
ncbi:MAG: hypothetical protein GXX86_02950 [Propionibacterium sp.]|nr:hypothetical protein [Propionibacterium sp.]